MYPRRILALLPIPVVLAVAKPEWPFFLAGCGIVALGEGLRLWACGHLRKNQDVITSGPYAYVRNPLYVGTFLIGFGFCLAASGTRMPGLVLLLVGLPLFTGIFFLYYLPYKCRVETARLERRFHEAAKHYNETVPSFIPRLTPYPNAGKQKWQFGLIFENSEFGTLSAVILGIILLGAKLFVDFP
jgi:protein-S-isoprenylcysteine O-methyltransferase Ste14